MIIPGLEAIAALVYGSGPTFENCTWQQQAYLQWPWPRNPKPPEPGIYWERTGGKTHRVTIVRAP